KKKKKEGKTLFQKFFFFFENVKKLEVNEETMKTMDFKTFYKLQRKKCDNKTLESLLILPIQRLPRYRMLLSEIVSHTEMDHPDLTHLQTALKFVEETASVTNERMKEYDARQIVREIEVRFVNPPKPSLVIPHRIFVKEGTLMRINRKGEELPTTFILFNDLLVYASPYSFDEANVTLAAPPGEGTGGSDDNRLKWINSLEIDDIFHVKPDERYDNRLLLFYAKDKSTLAYCPSVADKDEWLFELQKVIAKKSSSDNNRWDLCAPLWVPDTWSNVCQVVTCGSKFTFVNRKHHCRFLYFLTLYTHICICICHKGGYDAL
ncbi:FYVE, RhoGEF and PH domain containing 4-like isoform 2, partial [Reticulomyxa filosa]